MLVGLISKAKMTKTVVVAVVRHTQHQVYKRGVKRTMHYLAHDETGECKAGDQVEIVETRPLSRLKRWRVKRIIRTAA